MKIPYDHYAKLEASVTFMEQDLENSETNYNDTVMAIRQNTAAILLLCKIAINLIEIDKDH